MTLKITSSFDLRAVSPTPHFVLPFNFMYYAHTYNDVHMCHKAKWKIVYMSHASKLSNLTVYWSANGWPGRLVLPDNPTEA